MATNSNDVIKQLFATFSAPGAGIDLEKFRSDFLPQAPTPPTTTLQDPQTNRGNALATFGAGIAQPIQSNQSFSGNLANAALAGLDVLGQQRTQENEATQNLFNNQISTAQLQREQGTALTNAALANAQREYQQGLLVNAGLKHLLTADEKQNEVIYKMVDTAEALTIAIMESGADFFGQEAMNKVFFTPEQLFNETLSNLFDVVGVEGSPLQVQQRMLAEVGEQVKYVEIQEGAAEIGVDLPENPAEFLDKRDFWESKIRAAQEARTPGGPGSLTATIEEAEFTLEETAATTQTAGELESLVTKAGAFTGDAEPDTANIREAQALRDELTNRFQTGQSLTDLTDQQERVVRDAFNKLHQFLKANEGLRFNTGGFSRLNPPPAVGSSSTPNPSTTGVATRFNR